MTIVTCSVSNPEYLSPAGFGVAEFGYAINTEGPSLHGMKCYICGEPVCTACSTPHVKWYGKRVRACDNCYESYIEKELNE